jgi:hypothetical protein
VLIGVAVVVAVVVVAVVVVAVVVVAVVVVAVLTGTIVIIADVDATVVHLTLAAQSHAPISVLNNKPVGHVPIMASFWVEFVHDKNLVQSYGYSKKPFRPLHAMPLPIVDVVLAVVVVVELVGMGVTVVAVVFVVVDVVVVVVVVVDAVVFAVLVDVLPVVEATVVHTTL